MLLRVYFFFFYNDLFHLLFTNPDDGDYAVKGLAHGSNSVAKDIKIFYKTNCSFCNAPLQYHQNKTQHSALC